MYPVETYFFVRRTGKDFIKTVNGKCEVVQHETDDKVIKFTLENFSKLFEDFFMSVIFSAVLDNGKLRMSGGAIDHEPNYEILLQISDKFKYFRFTDSELTNKRSLFYEHNQNLTSYKLFELIRTQIKKDWKLSAYSIIFVSKQVIAKFEGVTHAKNQIPFSGDFDGLEKN